jgi:AbiV family abortive infection protein
LRDAYKALKTRIRRASKDPDIPAQEVPKLTAFYEACVQNAKDLLEEAAVLAEHAYYARAAFLAITAYEELGKAQLVADYAGNCCSRSEFEKAFSSHQTKTAYMMREALVDRQAKDATIIYDIRQALYQKLLRERALYVSYQGAYDNLTVPPQITKDECEYVLERVGEALSELEHAERLNGRIDSKSLFK